MAAIRTEYKSIITENIERTRKNVVKAFIFIVILGFILIVTAVYITMVYPKKLSSNDLALFALLFSAISILSGVMVSEFGFFQKYTGDEFENKIRHKEEELKYIGKRIDQFYLPLHDLLTTYDENVTNKAKSRKIIQINGHKHLAEPRVRGVFEQYASNGANSRKLLELVNRDIELLQNRFIEIKAELKDE